MQADRLKLVCAQKIPITTSKRSRDQLRTRLAKVDGHGEKQCSDVEEFGCRGHESLPWG